MNLHKSESQDFCVGATVMKIAGPVESYVSPVGAIGVIERVVAEYPDEYVQVRWDNCCVGEYWRGPGRIWSADAHLVVIKSEGSVSDWEQEIEFA